MNFYQGLHLTLLGTDISHSLSPQLHNLWLKWAGMVGVYTLTQLTHNRDLFDALNQLSDQQDFWGANLTHPFKCRSLEWDGATPDSSAAAIGAANTLYKHGGQWILGNTDWVGVKASLSTFSSICENKFGVIIVGSGASAKTLFHVLEEYKNCIEILCVYRNRPQHQFMTHYPHIAFFDKEDVLNRRHGFTTKIPYILINSTPVGLHQTPNPTAQWFLKNSNLDILGYWDLLYQDTLTFQYAKSVGIKVLNGMAMLKAQAWESFKLWFPQFAPHPLPEMEIFGGEIPSSRIQNIQDDKGLSS